MTISYFKRLRMEIDLRRTRIHRAVIPEGYAFRAWHPSLAEAHARAKFGSFRDELDSIIFPCLGDAAGCRRLMHDIAMRRGFVPPATWLVCQEGTDLRGPIPCGTIQGVIQSWRMGAIQNIGVVPAHRGQGLGKALLLKSLHGFQTRSVRRIMLEVTAENGPAVELYRSVGFVVTRSSYRAVHVPEAMEATS